MFGNSRESIHQGHAGQFRDESRGQEIFMSFNIVNATGREINASIERCSPLIANQHREIFPNRKSRSINTQEKTEANFRPS